MSPHPPGDGEQFAAASNSVAARADRVLARSVLASSEKPPTVSLLGVFAFVLVAEEGSFRRAADRLFLAPSTVSKLVSRLESDVGRKLLVRTKRRVGLTEAGSASLGSGRRLLTDLVSFVEDAQSV